MKKKLWVALFVMLNFNVFGQIIENNIGTDKQVSSLIKHKDDLYLTGDFNYFGRPMDGINTLSLDSGTWLEDSFPNISGTVSSVAHNVNGDIYLAGNLLAINNVPTKSTLAKIKADGSIDLSFSFDISGNVSQILVNGDTLFMMGDFTKINNQPFGGLAAINCTSNQVIDWKPTVSKSNQKMFVTQNFLIVSAPEIIVNSKHYVNGLFFDLKTLEEEKYFDTDGLISTVTEDQFDIYIGGSFSTMGLPNSSGNVIITDFGSKKTEAFPVIDGNISIIIEDGYGGMYVGGNFQSINDHRISHLAHILPDLSVDTMFNLELDGSVKDLVLNNDTLFFSGGYERIMGQYIESPEAYDIKNKSVISIPISARNCKMSHVGTNSLLIHSAEKVNEINNDYVFNAGVIVNYLTGEIDYYTPDLIYSPTEKNDTIYFSHNDKPTAYTHKVFTQYAIGQENERTQIPRFYGSADEIISDGAGGLFIGGDGLVFNTNKPNQNVGWLSHLVHLLPDNTQEPGFDFVFDKTIKTLALVGDTLFVGGDFREVNGRSFLGLIGIDLNTKQIFRINTTQGAYVDAMQYIDGHLIIGSSRIKVSDLTETISDTTDGNDYHVTDSFVYYVGRTRNNGVMSPCVGRRMRYDSLKNDKSWIVEGELNLNRIYGKGDYLYIGAFCNQNAYGCELQGQRFNGVSRLNIKTRIVDTLNIPFKHGASILSITSIGDTLLIAGRFEIIGHPGKANIVGYSLKSESILDWEPRPNEPVSKIFVNGNKICLGGSFKGLQQRNGLLHGYDIVNQKLLEFDEDGEIIKPELYVFRTHPTIIDSEHIYTTSICSIVKDKDTVNHLFKFSKKTGKRVQWSVDHDSINLISQILDLGDSLLVIATGNLYPPLEPHKMYMISKLNGGVSSTIYTFTGDVFGVFSVNGNQVVVGNFDLINPVKTQVVKFNKSSLSVDRNFMIESTPIKHLISYKDQLVVTPNAIDSNIRLCFIDKKTKDTSTLVWVQSSSLFGLNDPFIVDSTLFVSGLFQRVKDVKQNSYDRLNTFSVNLNSKTISNWNPRIYGKIQLMKVDGNRMIFIGNKYSLANIIQRKSAIRYNLTTDTYSNFLPSESLDKYTTFYGFGDTLLIAKNNYAASRATRLMCYNTKEKKLVDDFITFNKPSSFWTFQIHSNRLYIGGTFLNVSFNGSSKSNFFVYDLKNHLIVKNTPAFDQSVYGTLVIDSTLYLGGQFKTVGTIPQSGIARLNINSFELKPFKDPLGSNTVAYSFTNRSSLVGAVVRNKTTTLPGAYFFDHITEETYDLPIKHTDPATSLKFFSNLLFVNGYGRSQSYDLGTGVRNPLISAINLQSPELFWDDTTGYALGSNYYVTRESKSYLATLRIPKKLSTSFVASISPKEIATQYPVQLMLSGNGLINGSKIYLQNGTDTLRLVDSSYKYNLDGQIVIANLTDAPRKAGLYNLIVVVPSDTTLVINDAIRIVQTIDSIVETVVIGPDVIRPDEPWSYKTIIRNHSNFDRVNVPVFVAVPNNTKIDFKLSIVNGNSLNPYDTTSFVLTDSIEGANHTMKVYGLVIPMLKANNTQSIHFSVTTKDSDSIPIYSWSQSALIPTRFKDSLFRGYSYLISGLTDSCFLNEIDSINKSLQNQIRAEVATRRIHADYLKFVGNLNSRCGDDTLSLGSVLEPLWTNNELILNEHINSQEHQFANTGQQAFNTTPDKNLMITVINSKDPNIKIGNKGLTDSNYMQKIALELPYEIHFENDSSADASVQSLLIYDTLDMNVLNPKTVVFTDVVLGDMVFTLAPDQTSIDKVFDMRPSSDVLVRVVAKTDTIKGIVAWHLQALNSETLSKFDLNATQGFLPPNRDSLNGKGHVSFTITRHPNARIIRNEASIIFDKNEAIKTPPWVIVEDTDLPISSVDALPKNVARTNFKVSWTGSDETSGISTYDLYVSKDNLTFEKWLESTNKNEMVFRGKANTTYYFYSLSKDLVGNEEFADKNFETKTTVIAQDSNKLDNFVNLYPNPSTGEITIESYFPNTLDVLITNVSGQSVNSFSLNEDESKSIYLHTKGVYFIRILSMDDKQTVKKVVVI